jgi:hypothetical protein
LPEVFGKNSVIKVSVIPARAAVAPNWTKFSKSCVGMKAKLLKPSKISTMPFEMRGSGRKGGRADLELEHVADHGVKTRLGTGDVPGIEVRDQVVHVSGQRIKGGDRLSNSRNLSALQ